MDNYMIINVSPPARSAPMYYLYILYVYPRETIAFMFFNIKRKIFVQNVCSLNV